MKKFEVSSATRALQDYIRELNEEPIVLTEQDRPMLMPVGNDDLESVTLGTNPKFLRLIETSLAGRREHGDYSSDDVREKLGLPR